MKSEPLSDFDETTNDSSRLRDETKVKEENLSMNNESIKQEPADMHAPSVPSEDSEEDIPLVNLHYLGESIVGKFDDHENYSLCSSRNEPLCLKNERVWIAKMKTIFLSVLGKKLRRRLLSKKRRNEKRIAKMKVKKNSKKYVCRNKH